MEDRAGNLLRFGQRVRYHRELRGWQLDDLALRLRKTRASMSRIETGKQNLTITDIFVIAEALQVGASVLFEHETAVVSVAPTDSRALYAQLLGELAEGTTHLVALTAVFDRLSTMLGTPPPLCGVGWIAIVIWILQQRPI